MNPPPRPAEALVERLLRRGPFILGQVLVEQTASGFRLRHEHADPAAIRRHSSNPEDARHFARYTASGDYRPLKAAPNLAADWALHLRSPAEVVIALDELYPAALGMLLAHAAQTLRVTSFEETAGRQTGMYRIVGKVPPAMAREVTAATCHPGNCSRVILWHIAGSPPAEGLPPEKFHLSLPAELTGDSDAPDHTPAAGPLRLPVLCIEPCCILIGACRAAYKKAQAAASSSPAPEPGAAGHAAGQ